MSTHTMLNIRHQRGMTLVELMVALVLSLFLIGGIVQIFIGNRVSFAFNDGLARIQENARFSLEHIAYNARMAGYAGCLADVNVFNNLALANQLPYRDDIANGITGHDYNGTAVGETYAATATDPANSTTLTDWTPPLPAQLSGLVAPGSDVLIVRGAAGPGVSLATPFNDTSQLFVPPGHGFLAGELLVVGDCQKASLFQLSSVGTSGANDTLVHAVSGGFAPNNGLSNWPAEQDYGLGAEVSRHQTFAFFVGRSGLPNQRLGLFQHRLQRTAANTAAFQAEELVEGIDTLQIRFGSDPDNDGDIDSWAPADAVADWTRVLSLEVTLLARAADEYGTEVDTAVYNVGGMQFNPVNDRRHRQTFSTTVGIRNRLP